VDIRKKILLVGVGIAVLSAAIATQYATTSMGYEFNVVHPSNGFIRFVALDNATDGHRLLRVNNDTAEMILKFGDIPKGMNKTYTAAFAIVNEENFRLNVTGVSVNGSGAQYLRIWLHADATKDAKDDTSSVLLWNGTPVSGYWVLAAGNNNTTNMNGAATSTPWDTDDNIRYAAATPTAANGTTDFVWVQISVDTTNVANGNYNGYIEFHFASQT